MPAIIAALVSALGWMLRSQIGLLLVTGLAWLGMNFASVKLIVEPIYDQLTNYATPTSGGSGELGQMAAVMFQYLGLLNFDKALTMIISAVAMKKAITAGRLYLFKRGVGAV